MAIGSPPYIEVKALSVAHENKRVIENISFSTSAQRIAILGKNGSGKTTLAKTLCGVVPCEEGQVQIAGVDVHEDRRQAISTVGYLFQNADHQIIFPTVEEEVSFGLRNLGWDANIALEKAHETLAQCDRSAWATRHVTSLSGGEKQLLCLMSVLSMSPKVLFLDEPFSGLDYPTRHRLRAILDGLEITVIQITHSPQDIEGYEEALWIDRGQLMAHGPCHEVSATYLAAMEREVHA